MSLLSCNTHYPPTTGETPEPDGKYSNEISTDKMLLVLSAPSIHDDYYKKVFQRIVDFHINYAKAIMGNDNVVVIVDEDTKSYYEKKLPADVLLTADVHDIWMRDFTTANPLKPVQFTYTWASMTKAESKDVQNSFSKFADQYDIKRRSTELLIDGGNIVDNYAGKVITTTRFMTDNKLTYTEAKEELKELLGATEVAIIEPDDEVLAHSDGMVSWVDANILLVNDYADDPAFKEKVMNELHSSFPLTTIIEVPFKIKPNPPGQWDDFETACGINLNATVTFNNIYVPVFNMPHDQNAVNTIKQHTTKKVISVNAEGVCPMGGSVRCLTWQLAGDNAAKIIEAARKN